MANIADETPDTFREAFLEQLSRHLAHPTVEWPTVRCWTSPSLKKLFGEIRTQLAEKQISWDLTYQSLIHWLRRIGFEREVIAEGATFHILEIGAPTISDLDPFELLMAIRPRGVICFFSAVAFYSLTRQPVIHHHVAELQASKSEARTEPEKQDDDYQTRTPAVSPPRLGRQLFRFNETSFFVTRRSARLVPGVQVRDFGPRTQIRITTLEQTLMDALYKPFHAGGPDVVFEAWQEATRSGRIDEERMAEYLTHMQFPATARRVGAMLEIAGHTPGIELRHALKDAQATVDPNSQFARISLLPGVEYESLNENWLVRIP